MMNRKNVVVEQDNSEVPLLRTEEEEAFSRPAADVYESEEAFVILIDMPGATRGAISVSMNQNTLVVKSAVRDLRGGNVTLLHGELRSTGYYRVFNLGDGIDRENIDAVYENGVLTVRLFKKEEVRQKEIAIR